MPSRWTISGSLFSAVLLLLAAAGDEPARPETVWWSLQPLKRPAVPSLQHRWIRTPVDAFILQKLQEKGLQPAPEADRRTLLRRVTYDLTGLPPTPEELAAFEADASSDAYEKAVTRLLASPRYGERWARHWLDVAHYADSHGQDQDRPRPNAWPYRDYLIRALNNDTPYGRFIEEQIAGDVLFPDQPALIAATGFLAAGPWDESGLMGIREDSLDRQIAHYLDRDDIITTTMSTFAGLTVHCARCHDHKFDPITLKDYYALQAVFSGIDKAERSYDADPAIHQQRTRLQNTLQQIQVISDKNHPLLHSPERKAEVAAFERTWNEQQQPWLIQTPSNCISRYGSILKPLLDRSILAVGQRPEKDTYVIAFRTTLQQIAGLRLEVLCDETLPKQGPGRCDNGNLHLSEVRVSHRPIGDKQPAKPVKIASASADFNQEGWNISHSLDGNEKTAWGIHPAEGQHHQAYFSFDKPVGYQDGTEFTVELDQLHGGGHLLGRFRIALTSAPLKEALSLPAPGILHLLEKPQRSFEEQGELARLIWEQQLKEQLAKLPAPQKVYCGTNQFSAEGSFKPSPVPRQVHVLRRGDIRKPGELAEPAGIAAIPVKYAAKDLSQEGSRRAALAHWLSSPDNPLTWRTIVNRVWHYHFGKGIVDSPNDLGKMGGTPSHPELLDWLAVEFCQQGGSLKKLHYLIVTSSVYRQSCQHNPAAALIDNDNRLLWRMNRQRLDAESIRDTILLITDKLDTTMYGPPVKHFEMKPGIHVTPLADYEKFDVDSAASRRRSIYRYIFRTRPDPLLEALDCPDASQSAPVRGVSVGALQALTLWNNQFTLRYAEHLANRCKQSANDISEQVQQACQLVYQRQATDEEKKIWTNYTRQHGLANFCRVLFNSSEFLFIE